ncbi:UNVERIFIED_CONTAM: hypothetical protein FKN15_050061 [Acipenser sinensis]
MPWHSEELNTAEKQAWLLQARVEELIFVQVLEDMSRSPKPMDITNPPEAVPQTVKIMSLKPILKKTKEKYLVQLHEGELILQHTDHTTGIEDSDPSSTVIHISDGNASVEKQHGCDAFTVHTKKNEYQFRVPVSCQFKSTEEIKKERDEWVLAIDKFCLHWKRKSQFKPEDDGIYSVIQKSRVMDIKDQVAEKEPVSPVSGNTHPPLPTSPSEPNAANAVFPQTPSSTQLPPSKLAQTAFQAPSPKPPATVPPLPECVKTPSVPAPPPPPPPSLSLQSKSISTRTKAFHWDLLSQDKIPKSIWTQCNTEKIKIDADMLNDQFRVQELGTIAGVESATNHQILLNQKVAHNFSELILQHTDHTTGIEDSDPSSTVIHISDGNASVEKQHGCDAFTVHTKKNEYQFRVPVSCQFKSTEEIKKERDEWVLAIDKFCLHWKRKSQFKPEDDGIYSVIQKSRVMDIKDQVAEKEPVSPVSGNTHPPLPTSPSEPNAANAVFPQTPSSTQLPPSKLAQTVFQAPSPKSPATVPPPPEGVKTPSVLAPPPPPPPSLSLQSKSISTRTKAFHWDLLSQDKIPKSIWTQCNTEKIKIDADMLNDQFRVQELGTIAGVESATNHQILLNQKVAHNFNIFLRSFDVKPYELKEKVHIINAKDGGLTDEQISSLRRYVPTPDDIEMYKSYKGSPSELHVVDQYMMEMCNIPNLDNRLDLLLTIRELPISVDDLQPLINQMIKMCTQLRNSKSFVSVLKYLLVVGNYLNENAGKEKAKGFRLSSLTKLTQMRGKERKVTLLHALVQQIVLHEPDLAIFFQELTEFEAVPGASIKGLTAEVDVLKNELRKIIQHKKVLNKVLNKVNLEAQFYKDLKTVLQKYEADLSQLTKKCDEMKKLYSDILVKFGEPQDQDSQELFGWVCSFISNFKRIYEEIIA